jgi:hypothetical protein
MGFDPTGYLAPAHGAEPTLTRCLYLTSATAVVRSPQLSIPALQRPAKALRPRLYRVKLVTRTRWQVYIAGYRITPVLDNRTAYHGHSVLSFFCVNMRLEASFGLSSSWDNQWLLLSRQGKKEGEKPGEGKEHGKKNRRQGQPQQKDSKKTGGCERLRQRSPCPAPVPAKAKAGQGPGPCRPCLNELKSKYAST